MESPIIYSHRFATEIIATVPELSRLFDELSQAIEAVDEKEIADRFMERRRLVEIHNQRVERGLASKKKGFPKAISDDINFLLDRELSSRGWDSQSALFQEPEYQQKRETRWRLDFSKSVPIQQTSGESVGRPLLTGMAVEVAFNHGEAIAWNLLKPVLAAELNHVRKAIDIGAGVGVVICAASDMKKGGNFDNAVGEYEKFLRYLKPMRNQLTTPMLIIGLRAPKTFRISKSKRVVEWLN